MLYVTKVVNKILQEILLTSICKYLEKIYMLKDNTTKQTINQLTEFYSTKQLVSGLYHYECFFPTWRVRFEIYLLFFNNFSSF